MKTTRDILMEFGLELLNGGQDPSVVNMNQKDLEEAAERFLNRVSFSAECALKRCSYFGHYLAYGKPGEPNLEHDAFHAANKKCIEAQEAAQRWWDEHEKICLHLKAHQPCRHVSPLDRIAEDWEKKVRA